VWFEVVEVAGVLDYSPALRPIGKMFPQSAPDGCVIRPLFADCDDGLPGGPGEFLDVNEVESSERNAGKHHNIESEGFEHRC